MGKKRKSKGKAGAQRTLAEQLAGVKAATPEVLPPKASAPVEDTIVFASPAEAAQDDDALLALWGGSSTPAPASTVGETQSPAVQLAHKARRAPPPKATLRAKAPARPAAKPQKSKVAVEVAKTGPSPGAGEEARLREEVSQLRAQLAKAEAAVEKEQGRSERFLEARDRAQAAQVKAEGTFEAAAGMLEQRGIPSALHGEALAAIASAMGDELLPLLAASPVPFRQLLAKHVALSCGHEECEEELRQSARRQILSAQELHDCENCQGSDNRRAFQRMIRMCREKRRYKMIVVGGSPDAHTELARLTPDGLIMRIVTGKERRTKREATEDLRHADLLVVWGPTILPHKISELYTKQKDEHPDKVVLVLKRGVASFARELCAFLARLD